MLKQFQVILTWQVLLFDALLVVFCMFCESLMQLPGLGERWQRAITDNAIHATIGALVWLTVTADKLTWISSAQILLCALLSSAIDVDHFIAASSFTLEAAKETGLSQTILASCIYCPAGCNTPDMELVTMFDPATGMVKLVTRLTSDQGALSLQSRPMFHNTTLLVLVNILLAVSLIYLPTAWPISSVFACAWISHHLRDSIRRGLWLAPFDHTRPLPTWLYLSSIALLPLVVRECQHRPGPSTNDVNLQSSGVFSRKLLSVCCSQI